MAQKMLLQPLGTREVQSLVVLEGLSFFEIRTQNAIMNRDDVIRRLRECESELRAQGVCHAALFGSVARNEQRMNSDIDIMIELDPAARITMFDYVDIKEYIEGLFSEPVRCREPRRVKACCPSERGYRRDLCFLNRTKPSLKTFPILLI